MPIMTMTLSEYHEALSDQGVLMLEFTVLDLAMKCPMCGTIQSARDLIAAGAGKTFEEVEKFLGFSCVGRWTHGNPPPEVKGTQSGCNWTLGGLFRTHELEVVTPDGRRHMRFMPCTPEEAQTHAKRNRVVSPPEVLDA